MLPWDTSYVLLGRKAAETTEKKELYCLNLFVQVRITYKDAGVVAQVTFNGQGSNRTSWLALSRIVKSTWTDLTSASSSNYFSLQGYKTFPSFPSFLCCFFFFFFDCLFLFPLLFLSFILLFVSLLLSFFITSFILYFCISFL